MLEKIFDQYHENFDLSQANTGYQPGYIAVLCDSTYCVATWFSMGLAVFNQFSGVNCITIYSTDLFDSLHINS